MKYLLEWYNSDPHAHLHFFETRDAAVAYHKRMQANCKRRDESYSADLHIIAETEALD